MDCSPPGHPSVGFPRQECWSGLPFPSPGDLLDPGIESRSPTSQADSLSSEPSGKPQDEVPKQELSWSYHTQEGTEARKHMIQCVLEGMKKCIKKSANYEKVKRVTQEEKENPAIFHGQLVEVFRKYSSIDPSTSEGQSLLGQYFISQPPSTNIRQKLQKLQSGP